MENILFSSTKQPVNTNESLGTTKAKRYSVVLAEGQDKCYSIAGVMLLHQLETMRTVH